MSKRSLPAFSGWEGAKTVSSAGILSYRPKKSLAAGLIISGLHIGSKVS